MNDLPFPRLELRWVRNDPAIVPYENCFYSYEWQCKYMLVISPPDKLDIRSNIETETSCEYGAKNIEMELSCTNSSGSCYHNKESTTRLGTPFRDGVHILRDMKILNLPAFVTCGDDYRRIITEDDL